MWDALSNDHGILQFWRQTLAEKFANGRIVSLLEGGYALEALALSVEAHIQELLK